MGAVRRDKMQFYPPIFKGKPLFYHHRMVIPCIVQNDVDFAFIGVLLFDLGEQINR